MVPSILPSALIHGYRSLTVPGWPGHIGNVDLRSATSPLVGAHRGVDVSGLGESDWVVTTDYGRAYATLISVAWYETIAAAGHRPEMEPPDELAALVGSFLGR
ncbi:alpha/beta fold hydrolase [Acidisphaera sp. S103]|uniref:alpha/beta fold hydrolase n=1 Tax=Acidisphaera sp. S103 TaxID=1747223 RepID=UPI00131BBF2E|nr:hypothetical protein [Acidisphaera sp. S103]